MTKYITPKEIFEKVVRIEGRIDEMEKNNRQNSRKFTVFACVIAVLTLINLFVHLFIMLI